MAKTFERQALNEFEKWSQDYDHPGFFQRNLFIPTEDHIITELSGREKTDSDFWLLDVGCGTGKLLRRLRAKFPRAHLAGVDISPGMIRVAAEKSRNVSSAPIQFQVGNACAGLPYPAHQFDYVTCCHSFHHYPDQDAALREFRRVLKPTGRLFFVDGNVDCLWGFIMHRVIIGTYERFQVRHHRAVRLKRLFESNGLRVERQDRCGWKVPWTMTIATPAG